MSHINNQKKNKKDNKAKIGAEFEAVFEKQYGAKKQPRSGAGHFHKLDALKDRILFSLKATANKTFTIRKEDLKEAETKIHSQGGLGGDNIWALVFSFIEGKSPSPKDKKYIILELDDFIALNQEEAKIFELSNKQIKHQNANIPALLRKK